MKECSAALSHGGKDKDSNGRDSFEGIMRNGSYIWLWLTTCGTSECGIQVARLFHVFVDSD